MADTLTNELAQRLIEFMLSFPLPQAYKEIVREQVEDNSFCVECWDDCFKILFEKKENVQRLPLKLPTLLQGCQIWKESGPLSCQLFVEDGYIVQFEVVDLGLNTIDWDYFWSHEVRFDVDYSL